MISINFKCIKAAVMAVFLIMGTAVPVNAKKSSVMKSPDFAFPREVIGNSRFRLENSLKEKKPVESLRALMDIVVAENLVSAENAYAQINTVDSVGALLPAPYNAVAWLLEARIYNEIYLSDSRRYNARLVSEEMTDSNPRLWDASIFRKKINGLLTRALSEEEAAYNTPLSAISSLLNWDKDNDYNSYTVYDFIVYQALPILNEVLEEDTIIPFFKKADDSATSPEPLKLIDSLIALHSEPSLALVDAIVHKAALLNVDDRDAYLWQEIKRLEDSPEVCVLIYNYYFRFNPFGIEREGNCKSSVPDRKELYYFVRQIQNRYKGSRSASCLSDVINDMSATQITLNYPEKIRPESEFPVKVTASNVETMYLLTIEARYFESGSLQKEYIGEAGPVVNALKIEFKGELPFTRDTVVYASVEKPGRYFIIPSRSTEPSDMISSDNYLYPDFFEASDIDVITFNPTVPTGTADSTPAGCFVVNAEDGAPVEGAEVTFEKTEYIRGERTIRKEEKLTDAEGFAATVLDNSSVDVSFRGSKASASVYENRYVPQSKTLKVRFFTDRSLYRPGDRVDFMAVCFESDGSCAALTADREIEVNLLDANRNKAGSLQLTTDGSGRITGSFVLPTDGLTGRWSLCHGSENYSFEVAEYKMPTFLVSLEKDSSNADTIVFRGTAATFSGMPVSSAEVNYKVNYRPSRFFYGYRPNQSYSASVTSDANGEFVIELPLANLNPEDYRGVFTIEATVTDGAGETQTSPAVSFWISQTYNLDSHIPERLEIKGDTFRLNVPVTDALGLPTVKKVRYEIFDSNDRTVAEGEFDSPALELDSDRFPSGRYRMVFTLADDSDVTAETTAILYRGNDRKPPVETPLWVTESRVTVPNGQETADVRYGCSFPGQNILCVISDSEGRIEKRWIVSDGTNSFLKIKKPSEGTRKYVTLAAYRDHVYYQQRIELIPEEQETKLEIITETFRNRLNPGERETWRFRLSCGETPVSGYAYALLYDRALDAISPLYWNSNLFTPLYRNHLNLGGETTWTSSRRYTVTRPIDYGKGFPYFDFNTYGYPLIPRRQVFAKKKMKKSRGGSDVQINDMVAEAVIAEDSAFGSAYMEAPMADSYEAVMAETQNSVTADSGATEGGTTDEIKLRPIELPVAFFRPLLSAGDDGNMEIEFEVPDFNTTWNFIMGAYTRELKTGQTRLEATASKKVMVKMNAPRFLRTGDIARLAATVFNNSDDELEVTAWFEIFDPLTDEVLESRVFPDIKLQPSRNSVVTLNYDTSSLRNTLGIRIMAKAKGHTDGEQTVIPVLPSSQPVVEAETFYLYPGQKEYRLAIPSTTEDASMTFRYCDNPTWEVLTALPPILTPETDALSSKIYAFYANSVGYGLLRKNRNLYEGLQLITDGKAGDELLTANLEKDPELKTVTLSNTPWVNNAESETLRLSRLATLLDDKSGIATINALWESILKLRNTDGGWSWCPDMPSSGWMTQAVLINIGLLKNAGYLLSPDETETVTEAALAYCDKDYVNQQDKIKGNRDAFYSSMLRYLFTSSFFPGHKGTVKFRNIRQSALSYLESNWKRFSIFDKATLAITLWRDGREATARDILESLRQYASESQQKGAWFDNLDSSWGGANKMLTTARVLYAFNEIQPSDPIINRIRQWLLIQKQAQDWQEGLFSVDVIDAFLTSGTDWNAEYPAPEITVGSLRIEADRLSRLTGQCTINVDREMLESGTSEITVSRQSPSPAWGGIISQYVMPMKDVHPAAVTDLSIQKEYWKIIETPEGSRAEKAESFSVGDKVKVSLIVECGRDMDFVALTDERPACMEPTAQLSGYACVDGLWCYRETRNNATNLFFGFLPRGKHIISYDCYVSEEGIFASGVATLQCQYSPLLTAHSAGQEITVK